MFAKGSYRPKGGKKKVVGPGNKKRKEKSIVISTTETKAGKMSNGLWGTGRAEKEGGEVWEALIGKGGNAPS